MNPRFLKFVIRVVLVLLCRIPTTNTGYASGVDYFYGVKTVIEADSWIVIPPLRSVEFGPRVFDIERVGAIGRFFHPV